MIFKRWSDDSYDKPLSSHLTPSNFMDISVWWGEVVWTWENVRFDKDILKEYLFS